MTKEINKDKSANDHDKTHEKRTILKASLIGFAVGVFFIVVATMVSKVIN
jgi:hypothetical protein